MRLLVVGATGSRGRPAGANARSRGPGVKASFLYRHVILRFLAPMVPDKESQERGVRDSGLDWVLVCPPRFTGGQGRRPRGLRARDKGRGGHVSRYRLKRTPAGPTPTARHLILNRPPS